MNSLKPFLRFVTRGGENGKVDLIIGTTFKGTDCPLKPDTTYEIRDIMDELVIMEVGKSAMDEKMWGHDVSSLIECYKSRLFLTEAEYKRACESGAAKE